jgi:hypothetical protein
MYAVGVALFCYGAVRLDRKSTPESQEAGLDLIKVSGRAGLPDFFGATYQNGKNLPN